MELEYSHQCQTNTVGDQCRHQEPTVRRAPAGAGGGGVKGGVGTRSLEIPVACNISINAGKFKFILNLQIFISPPPHFK
jgi:hypothetical protein